jgi:ketosteroid isomerase-like protein
MPRVPQPVEVAVLEVNRAFYGAFQKRDNDAMELVWAEEHGSSCIHPGWAPLVGRHAVMASWRAIFGSPDPPRIEITDAHAVVLGGAAFVTCIEHFAGATIAATNVFALERGLWRMVHHHGSPMSAPRSSRRPVSNQMN